MKVLLSRHGNTFNPEDQPYWVGSQNDLPLVAEGVAQAHRLGDALETMEAVERESQIAAIYCGPLQRTKHYAEIAASHLKIQPPITVDLRLNELDYGAWSGLTDAEIIDKFGSESFNGWNEKCIWPNNADWLGNAVSAEDDARAFLKDMLNKHGDAANILVITSNGKLRYFLKLAEAEFQSKIKTKSFKVATGKTCLLDVSSMNIKIKFWNQQPADILTNLFTLD